MNECAFRVNLEKPRPTAEKNFSICMYLILFILKSGDGPVTKTTKLKNIGRYRDAYYSFAGQSPVDRRDWAARRLTKIQSTEHMNILRPFLLLQFDYAGSSLETDVGI